MLEILGFDNFFDANGVGRLAARLGINLIFSLTIVVGVYLRVHRRRDYAFTYISLNIITFLLAFLLSEVPMELGFALGLFAVFGVLRYRTEPIQIRELTYLFVCIGIGLLNALANNTISFVEILIGNSIIIMPALLFELRRSNNQIDTHRVQYDRVSNLSLAKKSELIADISERTGLTVVSVDIEEIDLVRDTVILTVHHRC